MIDSPGDNEIEVSIFGPGYGEAILVHVGKGAWIAIDSCIDQKDENIVPLSYLKRLNVDTHSQVKMIIATHWHDDHIRGIGRFFANCSNAKFGLANAFTKKDFLSFISANSGSDPSPLGNATSEIMSVIRQLRYKKQKPIFMVADRKIYSCNDGADGKIDVFSLSPTDSVVEKFLGTIAREMPTPRTPQRRASDLSPNEVSVALSIDIINGGILLGADLEESVGAAWTYIIENSTCLANQFSVFKIPHHGSKTGHCAAVWETILCRDPIAVLAPWNRGSRLPTEADKTRILLNTENAYITADPNALAPIRRDPQVKRSLDQMGISLKLSQPKQGHIRLRRNIEETTWSVKLDGTARHLRVI